MTVQNQKITKCYRFVTSDIKSEHGDVKWKIGVWKHQKGELIICDNGFHASKSPLDSLAYNFGTRWFEAEVRGKVVEESDRICAGEMRLVREIPKTAIRKFALKCAEHVIHIWNKKYPKDKRPANAIKAGWDFLEGKITEEELVAARDAAWAAWDAARAAAGDAERKWQEETLLELIAESRKEMLEK